MDARIAAIVLAAGRSSRLTPRNKLLEPVRGQAIVARVAEALSGLNVVVLHNPAFAEGLSTSLRAGLKALPHNCDGALVLLGDMPEIEIGDLYALMHAFTARDAICVPVHQGKRGNPILWGASYFAEMMMLTGDVGAKPLLARHEHRVIEVPVASPAIFADVDTPSDLARLRKTIG